MMDFSVTPESLRESVLERNGCAIHYWLAGPEDKPLVVLMHGATMDHRMFNAQVEALVPRYRVLVWDARGHGLSKPIGDAFTLDVCARDMLCILDVISAESAVIGGQSWGGYIAQRIYALAPGRVRAVFVIGSTPLAKAYSRLDIFALRASLRMFRIWPYGHLVRTIARGTADTGPVQDYALTAARQLSRREFLMVWRAVTRAVDRRGDPGFRFGVPLLLMHGDNDRLGTIRRDMPVWAEREPNAIYRVIPGAGHSANQDNPGVTNEHLLGFLSAI